MLYDGSQSMKAKSHHFKLDMTKDKQMKYVTMDYTKCEYLTAGKKYEYYPDSLGGGTMIDDNGDSIFICLSGSSHIGGNPWTLLDDTMGEDE